MSPSTVLLVEDDPAHAELISRALEDSAVDLAIQHVVDGADALEYLERPREEAEAPLRAVLLDLRIPRVSGLEVLQRVRQNERLQNLPVVVMSSSRARSDMTTAYAHGANGYLVKPMDFADLRKQMAAFATFWLTYNQI